IKERIGYGETNMRNSPANRRHNIANGISLLSSALVKPGEEFSTVAKLGAVDNTTGFLPELVIKDDRTVPEFGGGLCQVSTTLFRTVMNAGLKVMERTNHSYRVSYYEPPIGLDATIYLPKPDFKFLNDTPGYILIQGRVVGNKVIFELWGTSDGRTSAISTPVVTNVIDPPPPIYVDSDTLPIGETKITDHAHQGATAVAHYTVTRNGQVINQQTFRSVYKALPERGLHGTNPDLPPTNPSP
ncbi:MAG: VanW family protein, partial [Candidatus Berkelbacteria bacterium]|nr:VanW family protein [Candidatus Berkelbacteria bacterium]